MTRNSCWIFAFIVQIQKDVDENENTTKFPSKFSKSAIKFQFYSWRLKERKRIIYIRKRPSRLMQRRVLGNIKMLSIVYTVVVRMLDV